jgi:hypothetical protein
MVAGPQGEHSDLEGTRGPAGGARPHLESRHTIPVQRMPTLYPTLSQNRHSAHPARVLLPRLV